MSIEARKQAAEKILARPGGFKVCECCGSIVTKKVAVCPNCNAYRFDHSSETVKTQASVLASREPMSIEAADYE
jgi:RNA polymerase subunit RPABC4/transcription elongation factor Spt4